MQKERTTLKVAALLNNEGQLGWLPTNPRQWTKSDIDLTAQSLTNDPDFLEDRPLLVVPGPTAKSFIVFAGNLRLTAARQLKIKEVPGIIYTPENETDQLTIKRRSVLDNGAFGAWDYDALANEWDDLPLGDWGVPAWNNGEDLPPITGETEGDGIGGLPEAEAGSLEEYFIVPPFSVLDSRTARWQTRKTAWSERIGDLGESREEVLYRSIPIKYPQLYKEFIKLRRLGKVKTSDFREWLESVPEERLEIENSRRAAAGVSILDPVLAEISCKWFGIDGGAAFDCFAGDTCFGFVSASCGMKFTGIELREEQVRINNDRVAGLDAKYICDDGQNVAQHIAPESQDLLFSCPPYFNLEVYSNDPKDASNQDTYEDFIKIIRNAFTAAAGCLKENRFAVIVVGDVRDEDSGEYYDFPGDVVRIFKDAGLHFLNEMILLEVTTSAAIRAGKFMEGRKVCKCHQNVLVFYKGNPLMVADNFFPLDMSEEEKEGVLELIKSLETPEMQGLPEREYCAEIAAAAREKLGEFLADSGIEDVKNAMTWALGMVQTQMYKPLVDYFIEARQASGITMKQIREHLGNNMGGHYFTDKSQWLLPTREAYEKLRQILPKLDRPYDDIRREYDLLQNFQKLQNLQTLSRLQNIQRKI